MTATRVTASRDGVVFYLSHDREPITYLPIMEPVDWPDVWDACALPASIEGGADVIRACHAIDQWLRRYDRHNGQRGSSADHAHMDHLVTEMACDIDDAMQDGKDLSQRKAAENVVQRNGDTVSAEALRKAFNRAKSKGKK